MLESLQIKAFTKKAGLIYSYKIKSRTFQMGFRRDLVGAWREVKFCVLILLKLKIAEMGYSAESYNSSVF